MRQDHEGCPTQPRGACVRGAVRRDRRRCACSRRYTPKTSPTPGPNDNHITETVTVGGKQVDVVSPTGVPIGPTWKGRFLLGADSNGRDVAVRLLYGGRNSLEIAAIATLITMVLAIALGMLAGYMRGPHRRRALAPVRPRLGLPGGAARRGARRGACGRRNRPRAVHAAQRLAAVAGVRDRRGRFPYVAKPLRAQALSLREREFVDAARVKAVGPVRIMVERDPAQPRFHDRRVRAADRRQRDPAGGGPVLPRRGRAGPRTPPGAR